MISIDQLKNKESIANLWPMPVARSQDFTAFNYDGGTKPVISNDNGGMLIDATSISSVQNTGAISSSTATLQPGTYVFAAYICTTGTFTSQDAVAALYDTANNRIIASITPADFNSNTIRKTFTIETSVNFKILYKTPPSAMTVAYGCGVYSVRDWNKLQKLGVSWFNPIDKTYTKTSPLTSMWTGTAEASTSTMSKDGSVVATNLLICPQIAPPSSNVTGTNVSVTVNSPSGITVVSTGTGLQYGNYAALTRMSITAGSYVLVAHASMVSFTAQPYEGRGLFCDMSGNTFLTPITGPGWYSLPFSTDIDAQLDTRLYCGDNINDSATYDAVGLYTAADWAAMQALGIDWFSGDTYSNLDSLSNIASDADFLGTANASSSIMTIKKKMIGNIIPCPQTMHLGNRGNASNFRQSGTGACENMEMPGCPVPVTSGIHVNGNNNGAVIDDKTVPVGNYVFAVYAKAAAGVGIKLQIEWDGSSADGIKYFIGDGDWHQYFTTGNITDASVSYACIYNSPDNGGAVGDVYFAAPIFCTASDWDTLQYVNNQYFDGSTNLLSNN